MKYQNINKLTLPLAILLILLGMVTLISTYMNTASNENSSASSGTYASEPMPTADNTQESSWESSFGLSFDDITDIHLPVNEAEASAPDLSFDENPPADETNIHYVPDNNIYAFLSAKDGIIYDFQTSEALFDSPNLHPIVETQSKDLRIYGEFLDPYERDTNGISVLPDNYYEIEENRPKLVYLHILHYDFEGKIIEGELVANEYIYRDLLEIFTTLLENRYPIERIRLIQEYNCDDTASMLDNNTSCFNYRNVENSKSLSKHAYGCAIDLNPFYNPYVTYYGTEKETISPIGSEIYADRSQDFEHKIDKDDLACKLFKEHGFTWGGDWIHTKDYQHFQKVPPEAK